jgi:mRNA interferase RelE/StbE
MAYTVRVLPTAVKALASLPKNARVRIGRKIDALAKDPFPPGSVKLTGAKGDFYRIRTGDYRVLYQVREKVLVILVLGIGHRKDIYRRL